MAGTERSVRDHWGSHDVTLAGMEAQTLRRPRIRPVALDHCLGWAGGGRLFLEPLPHGNRLDQHLGVRRPWRKRGLGEALLLNYSFGEFYRPRHEDDRPRRRCPKSHPARPASTTKSGMYTASEFVTYEKELRAGRDIDEE